VETPSETLTGRVYELMESRRREPILSTTGTRAAIDSLAARMAGLEEAVRELSEVVQEVAESQRIHVS
jgi:hypothetical protein